MWLSEIEDWSPHDLRRTVRTGLSRLSCPAEIAEAVLGHSKRNQGTYNLHAYKRMCGMVTRRWPIIWMLYKIKRASGRGYYLCMLQKSFEILFNEFSLENSSFSE